MVKPHKQDAVTNMRYRQKARRLLIEFMEDEGLDKKHVLKAMDTQATRLVDAIEEWAIKNLE